MPQTIEASKFLSTLGVNVHLNFSGTPYQNIAAVKNAMNYLGLNTMRDLGAQTNTAPYEAMADAGFKFNFIVPGDKYQLDVNTLVSRLHNFAVNNPGAIVGIEGPNEINNWPVTYNGLTGYSAGVSYQKAVYDALNRDAVLNPVPVTNLSVATASKSGYSGLGDMSNAADIGNVHAYMSYGNQPSAQLFDLVSYAKTVMPNKPIALTETGYGTLASDTNLGVDEATQAKLMLNLVLDAQKAGVSSTFIYGLVDDPYSGGGAWNKFGLFRGDWSAKPAATALHNLTTVLTTGSASTATTAPDYTVTGLSGYNSSLTVHESNGTYDIVVWREPDIWDATNHRQINATTETATIQLKEAVSGYSVYDPLSGSTPIATGGPGSVIKVQVKDHPVIIELHGSGGGTTTTPTTPTETTSPTQPAPTAPAPAPAPTAPASDPGVQIIGTASADKRWGTSGSDTIQGSGGADTIYGLAGNDSIVGGAGDDLLYGKEGADILYGKDGYDKFVFDTPIASGVDTLTDFSHDYDTIYIDDAVFSGLARGNLASSAFATGAAAQDASDRIIYNPQTGDLMFDPDGTGAAQAQIFARAQPWVAFRADDFVVF